MQCKTCDRSGTICDCKNPSLLWCDKRVCRGKVCPDCGGKSSAMVSEIRPHSTDRVPHPVNKT